MQYIIRSFDVNSGQITVEYEGKWTYAIDLPVEDGAFPVGERLEEIIQGMAPVWLVERESSLATTPANAEHIQALVQPLVVDIQERPPEASLDPTVLEGDVEFIKQVVNEVLATKGL